MNKQVFNYQYYRYRIAELDYLRGIAVLMVMLSHYPVIEAFKHLWVGVDLFFVLSGYLITGVLLRDVDKSGRLRVGRFYLRRGLKIYPSFYFFLFFSVGLTAALRALGYPVFSIDITTERMLAEMFYFQHIFDGIWLHTWSLGVEEQFYLFLPLVLYFVLKTRDKERSLFITMVVFIVSVTVLRITECLWGTVEYKHTHLIDFYFRFDALFLGVAAACAERKYMPFLLRLPNLFWLIISAVGILIVGAFAVQLPVISCMAARVGYTLVIWSFTMWILTIVVLRKREFHGLAFLKPLVFFKPVASIGLYSYNIYLWHAFMIDVLFAIVYIATKANILFPYAWRYLAAYLVISVLAGYATTRWLEEPILRWRDRRFQ